MKTLTDEEYRLFQKLVKIWYHSEPDKTGSFFICGEAGNQDDYNLPERILVCPARGLDGFAVYTKETDYSAPEY